MCWCTPAIRTPFCGKGECVPPKQNIQPLVAWGKSTAVALLQQAEARRREAEADGEEFVVALCWAKKGANGNWRYTEAWSTGPNEVLFFMAHSLREHVKP